MSYLDTDVFPDSKDGILNEKINNLTEIMLTEWSIYFNRICKVSKQKRKYSQFILPAGFAFTFLYLNVCYF